jgi:hypothetical protein
MISPIDSKQGPHTEMANLGREFILMMQNEIEPQTESNLQ